MFTGLTFHKTSKLRVLEFLQHSVSHVSPFLSLSLILSLYLSQQANVYTCYRTAHSTYLSIIFTVERTFVGAQLRYICRRQVHCHWLWRQKGHRLRGHILNAIIRRSGEDEALSGAVSRDIAIVLVITVIVIRSR